MGDRYEALRDFAEQETGEIAEILAELLAERDRLSILVNDLLCTSVVTY